MAIEFHDATNNDGLFDQLGKMFAAQGVMETFRATTLPTAEDAIYDRFNALAVDGELEEAVGGLPASFRASRQSGNSLMTALRSAARNLLVELVHDDTPLARKTPDQAIDEVIRQMENQSETLDASTAGVTVTPDGSNSGDGVVIVTETGADGRNLEHAIAENITGDVNNGSVRLRGEPQVEILSEQWPAGSGTNRSFTPQTGGGLLTNGGFDDATEVENRPDGWIVSVGTIGTTLKMTVPEEQTVTISGTPTSGHYLLSWTDADGHTYTTEPIAFDATGFAVQAALRLLPGLESVEVETTGTSPNFTHTVTFTGIGGDVSELTSTNNLDTGSIAHATTTGGTANVYDGGRAVEFDSDGTELTTLNQRVTLSAVTAYAVNLWAIADVVPAAGVITVDLVDGISGTVIQDAEGNNNAITFNASSLTTSWQSLSDLSSSETVFRTPEVLPTAIYLRIRISTAVDSGTSVFIDRAGLVSMTELYRGGPLAAVFGGAAPFAPSDRWTVAVTNDRAGELHEWMNRNFDLARRGLLLPTDNAGAETIPDSLAS